MRDPCGDGRVLFPDRMNVSILAVLGLNWCVPLPSPATNPPNSYVEVLTPVSQNVTIFGDRAFKEVLKLI